MNDLFKLRDITLKDDIVNIYFEGNHNLVAHVLAHDELERDTSMIIGSIIQSESLSNKMIEAVDKMILQEDFSLFKDLTGSYTKCITANEWGKVLVNNIPAGVLSTELNLKFDKSIMNIIIDAFGFVENFQKELEIRLKDL